MDENSLLGDIGRPPISIWVNFGFKESCCLLEEVSCIMAGTFKVELDLIDNPFGFSCPMFFREPPFIPRDVFDLDKGFTAGPI